MVYKKFLGLIGCGYWGKNLARDFNSFGVLSRVSDTNQKQRIQLVRYLEKLYFLQITKNFNRRKHF